MPEPDAVRPRFQAMERHMRWIPGWQPLDEPEAILPTALEMPDDASLAARRIDALIVGVLTIGLAVAAATVPVGLVLLLGCWKRSEDPDYRLLIRAETDGGEAEQWEEEFEMVLGPVKTAVFAVYYVCNIIFLLAPGSTALSATPSCFLREEWHWPCKGFDILVQSREFDVGRSGVGLGSDMDVVGGRPFRRCGGLLLPCGAGGDHEAPHQGDRPCTLHGYERVSHSGAKGRLAEGLSFCWLGFSTRGLPT